MKRTIDYLIMDPEGNITILVTSPVDRMDYQSVAQALLDANPEAEQVGYIKEPVMTDSGMLPRMEMCGLEFCGNATRSFAFYESMQQEPAAEEIDVSVSGSESPLHAWIEADNSIYGTVRLQMPLPEEMEEIRIPITTDLADLLMVDAIEGQLVHMDGISHLVISQIAAETIETCDRETMNSLFLHLRDNVYQLTSRDIPAFGAMFADPAEGKLTPIVYVRDVDTIYFEGSCASGSNATAYALASRDLKTSDACTYHLQQPAGTLHVDVKGKDGVVTGMELYGGVGMSRLKQLEIED